MKFETRPCTIEAIQWVGNTTEIKEFCGNNANYEVEDCAWQVGKGIPHETLTIRTLEGDMKAQRGDFIIKGLNGEFYPCKPDIFIKKYKPQGLDACIDLKTLKCDYRIYKELNDDINGFLDNISQKYIRDFVNYELGDCKFKNDKVVFSIEKGALILFLRKNITEEEVFAVIEKDKYFLFNDELYTTKEIMDRIIERINLEIRICSK